MNEVERIHSYIRNKEVLAILAINEVERIRYYISEIPKLEKAIQVFKEFENWLKTKEGIAYLNSGGTIEVWTLNC